MATASGIISPIHFMTTKKIILVVTIIIFIVIVVIGFNSRDTSTQPKPEEVTDVQEVSTYDPMNIVLDFYDEWLAAIESTSTDPYLSGLIHEPLLSQGLREKLAKPLGSQEKDPVVCQSPIPSRFNGKQVYDRPDETQIVVFTKDQPTAGQAIVTVRHLNGGSYIEDISCSKEFDEPSEFNFEHEGNLLKSVPAPYDSNYWHLVYTQDSVPGYAVPLFFNAESTCTDTSGIEAVCDEGQFIEAQKVMVRGNMTESGLDVVELEFTER